MHCNNQSWHWGNLVHIYAVFQYNLIVENIISGIYRTGGTIHCNNHCHLHHCWQVITTCKFFSVDFQLLPTCLQHRVVPCVLNPAHRVLSMRVNHLHKVLSEKDIQRAFLCWQTDSSPCTSSATPTVHHLHQVLREKDGEICFLFIERKKINQTISDKWVLKIVLHMWSPVIQSRYMTAFQSVYMCIVAKRCQHVTFSDIMQKWLIKNSTSDNRNTKHIMTSKKGWWQIKLFMTDIFHTSWWVIQVVTW